MGRTDCYSRFQFQNNYVFLNFHRLHFGPLPFKDFDSVFMMVNCWTKMTYFLLCNKIIISEQNVKFFVDYVYKHHCFLYNITFDHCMQFTSKF